MNIYKFVEKIHVGNTGTDNHCFSVFLYVQRNDKLQRKPKAGSKISTK